MHFKNDHAYERLSMGIRLLAIGDESLVQRLESAKIQIGILRGSDFEVEQLEGEWIALQKKLNHINNENASDIADSLWSFFLKMAEEFHKSLPS